MEPVILPPKSTLNRFVLAIAKYAQVSDSPPSAESVSIADVFAHVQTVAETAAKSLPSDLPDAPAPVSLLPSIWTLLHSLLTSVSTVQAHARHGCPSTVHLAYILFTKYSRDVLAVSDSSQLQGVRDVISKKNLSLRWILFALTVKGHSRAPCTPNMPELNTHINAQMCTTDNNTSDLGITISHTSQYAGEPSTAAAALLIPSIHPRCVTARTLVPVALLTLPLRPSSNHLLAEYHRCRNDALLALSSPVPENPVPAAFSVLPSSVSIAPALPSSSSGLSAPDAVLLLFLLGQEALFEALPSLALGYLTSALAMPVGVSIRAITATASSLSIYARSQLVSSWLHGPSAVSSVREASGHVHVALLMFILFKAPKLLPFLLIPHIYILRALSAAITGASILARPVNRTGIDLSPLDAAVAVPSSLSQALAPASDTGVWSPRLQVALHTVPVQGSLPLVSAAYTIPDEATLPLPQPHKDGLLFAPFAHRLAAISVINTLISLAGTAYVSMNRPRAVPAPACSLSPLLQLLELADRLGFGIPPGIYHIPAMMDEHTNAIAEKRNSLASPMLVLTIVDALAKLPSLAHISAAIRATAPMMASVAIAQPIQSLFTVVPRKFIGKFLQIPDPVVATLLADLNTQAASMSPSIEDLHALRHGSLLTALAVSFLRSSRDTASDPRYLSVARLGAHIAHGSLPGLTDSPMTSITVPGPGPVPGSMAMRPALDSLLLHPSLLLAMPVPHLSLFPVETSSASAEPALVPGFLHFLPLPSPAGACLSIASSAGYTAVTPSMSSFAIPLRDHVLAVTYLMQTRAVTTSLIDSSIATHLSEIIQNSVQVSCPAVDFHPRSRIQEDMTTILSAEAGNAMVDDDNDFMLRPKNESRDRGYGRLHARHIAEAELNRSIPRKRPAGNRMGTEFSRNTRTSADDTADTDDYRVLASDSSGDDYMD